MYVLTLGSGEKEDVVHLVGQALGFLDDDLQGPLLLFLAPDPSQEERLPEHPDLGQRGPELMGHTGDKVGPKKGKLLLSSDLEQGCDDQARRQGCRGPILKVF